MRTTVEHLEGGSRGPSRGRFGSSIRRRAFRDGDVANHLRDVANHLRTSRSTCGMLRAVLRLFLIHAVPEEREDVLKLAAIGLVGRDEVLVRFED